jgi:preprotein translocase subunit SecA
LYIAINQLIPQLVRQEGEADPRTGEGVIKPGDFTMDEKAHSIHMTEQGHENAERLLSQAGLLPEGASLYDPSNIALLHHLVTSLKAHHLYHRDQHYVSQNGEIVIVDEFTGRLMSGRRWSDGLHQAVEAKEGVAIQPENQTLASITFQNYFRLYGKLSGMTGTADTEAYEFQEIYGLETVVIPPNRPSSRTDQLDRVYKTTKEKYVAAIEDIRECHERGQPVLVGTSSIENSEIIANLLQAENLPHEVLNAKQHAREADIIIQAGRPGAITIATNMAGRGTDIVLGGNLEKMIEAVQTDAGLDDAAKATRIEAVRQQWKLDHEKVRVLGGLRIIATERHESRRIDNQLRGRSGRQGDPGSSRFYLSLDDSLMRIFAGDRVRAIMDRLKMPEGEAIEAGIVTRSIESAQRKVEARNFDIRKQLLEYDDVSNDQRKVIYQQRNDILDASNLRAQIDSLRDGCFSDIVHQFVPAGSVEEQWDLPGLERNLRDEWAVDVPVSSWVSEAEAMDVDDIVARVLAAAKAVFDGKVQTVGEENFTQFERVVLLQTIDSQWREHLSSLDYLRQGIHLRGYAQKQPKQEYKREAFVLFGQLLDSVKNDVTRILMNVRVQSAEQVAQAAERLEERAEQIANVTYTAPTETGEVETIRTAVASGVASGLLADAVPRVGRNDVCPCGSGKKYKHCHGKLD